MTKLISFYFLTIFFFQLPAHATDNDENVRISVRFEDPNYIHYFNYVTFRNRTTPINANDKKNNIIVLDPCTTYYATNLMQAKGHSISLTYSPCEHMTPVQISCEIDFDEFVDNGVHGKFLKEKNSESKLYSAIDLFITVAITNTVPTYNITCKGKPK